MLRYYDKETVLEAALERIRFLYREFEDVIVCTSGGKDSTVVYELCRMVATEMNRLPLKVMFLDQEAEWQSAIDYVREQLSRPDTEPYWYQFQFKIENASSVVDRFLLCWDESKPDAWMRPKEPGAITVNRFDNDRWPKMFEDILRVDWAGRHACMVGGIRTEESPGRLIGLTQYNTYKGRSWGRRHKRNRDHYTFYPIYDWKLPDVWKAIHDHGWSYCSYYDEMYRRGAKVAHMRVSSLHHEQAVQTLFVLQEMEAETYNKLTARLKGVDMAGKMGQNDYFVKELPPMFSSWTEYRDFLLVKLINNPAWIPVLRERFAAMDATFAGTRHVAPLLKAQVHSILTNDLEGVKLQHFANNPQRMIVRVTNRIKRLADAAGLDVITPYVNNAPQKPVRFRCQQGHEFDVVYKLIPRKNFRCTQCLQEAP